MAKYQTKTHETTASVADFIANVEDDQKQKDSWEIVEIMKKASGFEPKMWGPSIIGFGTYHYKYESGHEGDSPLIAFSPRKAAITLYLSMQMKDRDKLLKQFGKHKISKACIYIKRLSDIDIEVFKKMVKNSLEAEGDC